MRLNTGNWPIVALLLALLLPLQSFASISDCAAQQAAPHAQHHAPMAHEHCAERASLESALQHHSHCCDCCAAAIGQAASEWIPPRADTLRLSLPVPRAPLTLSLDRLDRPPRTLLV